MNSLRIAFVPGVIAGLISIFTSWFWVGLVFHKFQARTPQTWRRETGLSHAISSLVTLGAAIVIATLYVMVARGNGGSLGQGFYGAVWFAILAWAALAAPVLINNFIYVNLHPLVIFGLLLTWLTNALLASLITAWWLG
ncbi:MAG: hypothetical protein ACR2HH_11120 [Chthoniobacterales bacterium]